jgi:ABC-type xylose transport system permease subunit
LLNLLILLKMVVLYGLAAQCLLHAATYLGTLHQTLKHHSVLQTISHLIQVILSSQINLGILSVLGILLMAACTAMIEAVAVKLQWRRTPEFIAFALTISLFATVGALVGGLYARHYL